MEEVARFSPTTTFRINAERLSKLERLAAELGTSRNQIVNSLIDQAEVAEQTEQITVRSKVLKLGTTGPTK